ncbi:MAG: phosphoenolpyruvate--protein phosphotransferase, partial [Candidatus Marinimicrobia bacterium]|nr:phosphoenolpyruvate--protein phosphotransferase [Candidatus Neomarinimicrobiota bacterium]
MYENNHKYFGLAVSPGIASGKVYLHRSDSTLHIPRMQIQRKDIPCEMDKLIAARIKVEHELYTLRETISTKFGASYAELIDSQIAILNDEEITKQIQAYMDEHLVHVPFAFRVILNQYIDIMDGGQSDFFKERIMDVRDIKQQVLKNLLGLDHDMSLSSQTDSIILVSKYLSPGDIIRLSSDNVVGMVSETGGKTSHAAILAKAMGIPTLLGVEDITYNLNSGDRILLDALHGHLIYQPDQETEQHYRKKMARYTAKNADYKELRSEEAQTCDGRKIELLANIELPVESKQVLEYKAKGVGLYRSEYLYLMKKILPTEEELFDEYYRVVSALPDKEIIIRTIDLGGDKIAAALAKHTRDESNTFMGYRAIRISLDQPDLFITQLKAILRASAFGKISIMLPMITVMEELISAKEFIEKAKNELRKEGKKFNENIPVGILVEVPSAAMMAEEFAAQVDFLSIGTNDLTQYLLAVDRGNEKVNKLYNHFDPVVLRTLRWIVNAANSNKVPLSVCGEMAGDPKAIIVLLGLGINRLSMSPVSLDRVRFAVRNL